MLLSKAEMKLHLPPSACKQCVAWFRYAIGSSLDAWHQPYKNCPRCGIAQWETLAKLNEELLGIAAPASPPKVHTRSPRSKLAIDHKDKTDSKWLSLYQSNRLEIRLRAAKVLLNYQDTSTPVLIDMLDTLSHYGLGASIEQALKRKPAEELIDPMLTRLGSSDDYIREVACHVLGQTGDFRSTQPLLRMLDDSHLMVRRAAGFALSCIKDQSALPTLRRQFYARRNDDINVVWALEAALKSLGEEPKLAR